MQIALIVIGVILVLALIVTLVVVLLVRDTQDASAEEIFLEPAAAPGPDPFTESIPVDPVDPEAMVVPPRARASGGTLSQYGNEPGLYGGTQDNGRCDRTQLVTYLQANPDKARAWTDALNTDPTIEWSGGTTVSVSQISTYVDELTPITLISDTRVTNYGYVNGRATPRQVVLQAGTAVLVDKWGVPRTKCACGNPLTSPTAVRPKYTGARWRTFDPTTVIVVQQSITIIQDFTLINIYDGEPFTRPAGTGGTDDRPAGRDTTTSSTTTSTSRTSPSTLPPVTSPRQDDVVGPWQLSGSGSISTVSGRTGDDVTGSISFTVNLSVTGDGSITGSGSGEITAATGCFLGDGSVSDLFVAASYSLEVVGSWSGSGPPTFTMSPSPFNVSITNFDGDPQCRSSVEQDIGPFVSTMFSTVSMNGSNGASTTMSGANVPVVLSR
jgi:hypothetical protein